MRCSASARPAYAGRVIGCRRADNLREPSTSERTRCSNRKSRRSLPPWTRGIRPTRRRARPPNSVACTTASRPNGRRPRCRPASCSRTPSGTPPTAVRSRCGVTSAHRTPRGTVLFFHGGGFVVGSLDSHALITAQLAADTGRRDRGRLPARARASRAGRARRLPGGHARRARLAVRAVHHPLTLAGDSAGGCSRRRWRPRCAMRAKAVLTASRSSTRCLDSNRNRPRAKRKRTRRC